MAQLKKRRTALKLPIKTEDDKLDVSIASLLKKLRECENQTEETLTQTNNLLKNI